MCESGSEHRGHICSGNMNGFRCGSGKVSIDRFQIDCSILFENSCLYLNELEKSSGLRGSIYGVVGATDGAIAFKVANKPAV